MQLNRLPEGGASFIPQQHTLGCAAFISFRYFRIVAPMSPKIASLATASNTNSRKGVRVAVRVQRGGLRCPPEQAGSGSPPNRGSRRTGLPNFRTRWLQGRDTGVGSSNHLFLLDFKTGQA